MSVEVPFSLLTEREEIARRIDDLCAKARANGMAEAESSETVMSNAAVLRELDASLTAENYGANDFGEPSIRTRLVMVLNDFARAKREREEAKLHVAVLTKERDRLLAEGEELRRKLAQAAVAEANVAKLSDFVARLEAVFKR